MQYITFKNVIFLIFRKYSIWAIKKLLISQEFQGANQIRTGDRGVADLCLTTWPWRLKLFDYSTGKFTRQEFICRMTPTGIEPVLPP